MEEATARNEDIYVTVMLDEMALHQNLFFDGNTFQGGVEFGSVVMPDCLTPELATEALCFMAVPQKFRWKIPLGFFLIHRLNATGIVHYTA